ncbi:hypothetical protein JTB14_035978 [Gonioctena quinquepunctata]|nr:hypothetical protein JTB14_035978 [Gonioctena quinquepunctata]
MILPSINDLSKAVEGEISADEGVDDINIHGQKVPRLPNKALANLHVGKIHYVSCGLEDIECGALEGSNISGFGIAYNEIKANKEGVFNHKVFTFLSLENNQISQIEAGFFDGRKDILF